jgi:hypothetical protein
MAVRCREQDAAAYRELHLCSMSNPGRPPLSELPAFYHRYVERVTDEDLNGALEESFRAAMGTFARIDEATSRHRYAPGKWSVRDLVQHLIDCDRIFAYRALRIARGDTTPLPGFDEDAYAAAAGADVRPWCDLCAEWQEVRQSLNSLFRSFTGAALLHTGTANSGTISVRALGWIAAGHTLHHLHILHERYLTDGRT